MKTNLNKSNRTYQQTRSILRNILPLHQFPAYQAGAKEGARLIKGPGNSPVYIFDNLKTLSKIATYAICFRYTQNILLYDLL
jgi:hypothetical protein